MNNRHYSVCGIVTIEGKVLFVRHTYGQAKDRILLPGGYVKEGELPNIAAEREIFEETSVVAKTKSLISIEFKPERWCAVFVMDYIKGEPTSDGYENSEVLLLTPEEAVLRPDITNMSREILKKFTENHAELNKGSYIARDSDESNYAIFGVN